MQCSSLTHEVYSVHPPHILEFTNCSVLLNTPVSAYLLSGEMVCVKAQCDDYVAYVSGRASLLCM